MPFLPKLIYRFNFNNVYEDFLVEIDKKILKYIYGNSKAENLNSKTILKEAEVLILPDMKIYCKVIVIK